jgi:hypothetical protein
VSLWADDHSAPSAGERVLTRVGLTVLGMYLVLGQRLTVGLDTGDEACSVRLRCC